MYNTVTGTATRPSGAHIPAQSNNRTIIENPSTPNQPRTRNCTLTSAPISTSCLYDKGSCTQTHCTNLMNRIIRMDLMDPLVIRFLQHCGIDPELVQLHQEFFRKT